MGYSGLINAVPYHCAMCFVLQFIILILLAFKIRCFKNEEKAVIRLLFCYYSYLLRTAALADVTSTFLLLYVPRLKRSKDLLERMAERFSVEGI